MKMEDDRLTDSRESVMVVEPKGPRFFTDWSAKHTQNDGADLLWCEDEFGSLPCGKGQVRPFGECELKDSCLNTLIWVIRGALRVTSNSIERVLEEDDRMILPPNCTAQLRNTGNEFASFVVCLF